MVDTKRPNHVTMQYGHVNQARCEIQIPSCLSFLENYSTTFKKNFSFTLEENLFNKYWANQYMALTILPFRIKNCEYKRISL